MTIQMVLFIMLYKVTLIFQSVDKIELLTSPMTAIGDAPIALATLCSTR